MSTPPPPTPNQKTSRRSWMSRHWKWFVPLTVVASLVLVLGLIAGIVAFVFGLIRQSEPYQHALTQAKAHPQVREVLGEPIEAGFYVLGNYQTSSREGEADLSLPLHGPKGNGFVHVGALKERGRWTYEYLDFVSDEDQEIDLLAGR